MRLPRIALCATLAVLSASCGGEEPIVTAQNASSGITASSISLPGARPATPTYLLETRRPLSREEMKKLKGLEGVAGVAGLSVKRMKVRSAKRTVRLDVAQVEPLQFRNLAPKSTLEAEFVWSSLILGATVPTPDAAKKLKIGGPARLEIGGVPDLRVGAYADNGVPNIADVLIGRDTDRELDMPSPRTFVVGAKPGTIVEKLGRSIRRTLDRPRLQRLIPKAQQVAPSTSSGAAAVELGQATGGVIGTMHFEILEDGFIRPDPAWVAANIATGEVPIIGSVTCHRVMIPRLQGALGDLARQGLAHLIKPGGYGGCYVPRFIDRDPTKPLSNHAFGLAVDFNTPTNQLGTKGDMDPRVVAIFEAWGFSWGGYWDRPDPMHFELVN